MRTAACRSCALLLAVLLGPGTLSAREAPRPLRPDHDGIEITEDTRLESGTWVVLGRESAGVIRILTDGVTLDLGGATLSGAEVGEDADTFTGIGIEIDGAKDVKVKNGRVRGFKIAVRAHDADGLVLEDLDASGNYRQRLHSTPQREDPGDWLWPHHNDEGEWETRYGAGFSLSDCESAHVRRCTVHGGQNGLLLTRCRGCFVYDDDFSFNSGWGIALYRASANEVSHNRCDFCVRGYSHGVYHRGQDSAGLLVFEQSSGNVFARNSATHSGDGFFLYAGHETTQRTGKGGSNDNLVLGNDFRYAVANGIEATFSRGNRFVDNDCSGCDHGVWAGYSHETLILANEARDCMTAGVSIEHGHDNQIVGNRISGARYGIHLWWDEDPELLQGPFGRLQDTDSRRNLVLRNELSGTTAALRLWRDAETVVLANRFPADPTVVQLGPGTRPRLFGGNRFGGALEIASRASDEIVLPGEAPDVAFRPTEGPVRFDPSAVDHLALADIEVPEPSVPPLKGTQDVAYPAELPRGREQMRIDEWGPVHPGETRLFPAAQHVAGPRAALFLLGKGGFQVTHASEGVAVTPTAGEAPARIDVDATADGPAWRPYEILVSAGGSTLRAEGSLLRIPWDVAFFPWTEAQDPVARPEAFAALLAGEPAVRRTMDALDFPWQGAGPEGVPADHFATRARASLSLPAGLWQIRVVSDDGVRVRVDGVLLVERWDRHGPTEDTATFEVGDEPATIEVDHFEIDGWAWLSLRLEPAP